MWPEELLNTLKRMHFAKENKTIQINGSSVAPGQSKLMRIEIAKLPTGTLIDIPIHVFNAKEPGPTVLLQAGLHGDEINGVETLRRMLELKDFKLKKGAVVVVPILNVFGFIHFSRDVPDGKDVNRSFPGRKSGSLASRIAYHYTQQIVPQIDVAIDLHTGGGQRENYPQVRFTENDEAGKYLAELFNAPFYFASRLINGSFRKMVFKKEKPVVVFEAGESMRFDEQSIAVARKGILNVLSGLEMLQLDSLEKSHASILFEKTTWIRAPRAGMFIPIVKNGELVDKGNLLGKVTDTFAKNSKLIKAPKKGHIFSINHQAVVNQGDALFRIGY